MLAELIREIAEKENSDVMVHGLQDTLLHIEKVGRVGGFSCSVCVSNLTPLEKKELYGALLGQDYAPSFASEDTVLYIQF